MTNPIQSFDFSSQAIRSLTINNEPWFVAVDVCKALEISNPSDAVRTLDDDEFTLDSIEGSHRKTNIVNESGLYALIFKSRKPVAKKFRKWVTNEVLPAIRQTGSYAVPAAPAPVEYLISKDMNNIRKIIEKIVRGHKENDKAWLQAIWFRLRAVTACPAPNRFEAQHIPMLTEELKRIWELSVAVRTARESATQTILKRVLRGGELQEPLIKSMNHQLTASLAEDASAVGEGLGQWSQELLDALATREETHEHQYISHLNEPQSLLTDETESS